MPHKTQTTLAEALGRHKVCRACLIEEGRGLLCARVAQIAADAGVAVWQGTTEVEARQHTPKKLSDWGAGGHSAFA